MQSDRQFDSLVPCDGFGLLALQPGGEKESLPLDYQPFEAAEIGEGKCAIAPLQTVCTTKSFHHNLLNPAFAPTAIRKLRQVKTPFLSIPQNCDRARVGLS